MGGGHAGGGHYGGGGYRGGYYGGRGYGYGGLGYGLGGYGYGLGGYGYGGLGGYGYGSGYGYGNGGYGYSSPYLYSSPQYSFYPSAQDYGTPNTNLQNPTVQNVAPVDTPKNAQVKVLLSDASAKVWFDGSPTTSTGTERLYHTPDLAPGATNSYRIRASWVVNGKEMVQEQVVSVSPGRGSVVDFTRPVSEGVSPPPLSK
jgi:uncharacterized protein (TIGR03000 family)